jgi:membrane protein YdbS with pleckstrin-like domain
MTQQADESTTIVLHEWPVLYWAAGASCLLIPMAIGAYVVWDQWPVNPAVVLGPIAICAVPAPLLFMARSVRTEIDLVRGTVVQERKGWWGNRRETIPASDVAEVTLERRHTSRSSGLMPVLKLKSGETLDLARDLAMTAERPTALVAQVEAALAGASGGGGTAREVKRSVRYLPLLAYLAFLSTPYWWAAFHTARPAAQPTTAEGAPLTGVAALAHAARNGDRSAMIAVAEAYRTGQGVPRDPKRALAWLEEASSRYDVVAAHVALGEAYRHGRDVAIDLPAAYLYYARAARWNHAGALKAKAEIAPRLSPAELAQAKRQLAHWR